MRIVRILRRLSGSRGGRVSGAALAVTLTAVACLTTYQSGPEAATAAGTLPSAVDKAEEGAGSVAAEPGAVVPAALLQLPSEKLASLQIETEPVARSPRADRLRVTGRLEINASRVAHVHSLTEGVVREVCVELGDTVVADQVLAYIDSREVGEAKLALVKARLDLQVARELCQWDTTLGENVTALLAALEEGIGPDAIEANFQERPLGSYREQLVAALTRLKRAAADHLRIESLGQQGILPEKQTQHALVEHEAARAAYQALVEQVRFDVQQRIRGAQQRLQAAAAAAAIARAQLLILGYDGPAIEAMDPLAEGERVACYPVRAPLAGTVIARPMLLAQHVDEATTLVELADVSTVWLRADVFEKDLPSLTRPEDAVLRFRTASYPQREFTAKVFTVGHAVSDETRAVRLLATADNAARLLKPGMFVDVECDRREDVAVLQVPAAAIQHHAGAAFAFVACGPGRFARRNVQLGPATATAVEVTAGLQEGERVVVKGGFALKSEMLNDLLAE